jgi:urease accessory protein
MEAILVNTGGGLVEGDHISIAVSVGPGARLIVGTQGAEKIYRSLTSETVVDTDLFVAEGAVLIWSPQETIVFDGAHIKRDQVVSVAKTSRFLASEVVVFGRVARGERFAYGQLKDSWTVRCEGQLLWVDKLRLLGDISQRTRRFSFGDSAGLGTIIYFGCDSSSILPQARDRAARLGGGATLVNGVLVARFLNDDEARLRAASSAFADGLRKTIVAAAERGAA